MRIPLLALACLAAFALPLAAEASALSLTWRESTPGPEPRAGYAGGAVDGKLILVGGTYWEGSKGNWTKKVFSASTHAFDPKAQTWEKLPDAPVKIGYPAVAEVGGSLYVMGGVQDGAPGREVFILSRHGKTYTWAKSTPLPETRVFPTAVAVGHTIYLIGGTREFEPFDAKGTCCTSRTDTRTMWRLDTRHPEAGWVVFPEFPGQSRWGEHVAHLGGSLYLFGGNHQAVQEDPVKAFDEVLHFDLARQQWSRLCDMPHALQGAAPVVVKDQIILVGANQKVAIFDPEAASFTPTTDLPHDASLDAVVKIGSMLVGSEGENRIEGPRRRSSWTFIGELGKK